MRTFYNILFKLFFVAAAPFYYVRMRRRGNWRPGFRQRFGAYDAKLKQALTNRDAIWIHAVGPAEINVCTLLINAIELRLPNLKIVVSTTNIASMAELQRKLPSHVSKIYYPIDRRSYVSRALNTIRPLVVILLEAELWPNFMWRARDQEIPTFLVNISLSQRLYRRYRRFGFLFRPVFASLAGIGVQTEAEVARLRKLGCRPEAIQVVGNLEFEAAKVEERRLLDVPTLVQQLGLPRETPMLVGGSTHAGEETLLGDQFLRLRQRFPNLLLVLAPRELERCREVGRELQARGLKVVYRNEITSQAQFDPGEVDCLLVNTTGELRHFYKHATVVFVGQSFAGAGGQDPLDPALRGQAMVFGPKVQEHLQVVRDFVEQQGALQACDEAGLEAALSELLANEEQRQRLIRNAAQVVRQHLGPIEKIVDMIVKQLDQENLYVVH